jgi:hypothetical protein
MAVGSFGNNPNELDRMASPADNPIMAINSDGTLTLRKKAKLEEP